MNWFQVTRGGRRVAAIAMLSIGLGMAGTVLAQTDDDADSAPAPHTGLDLPSAVEIFGKFDPNVRKPTAIVNRTVITGTDVDQRMALIVALNDIKLTAQLRDQLRLQVLRSLIDETLQVQEAAAHDIKVTPQELDQGFNRVARNFNRSPDEMRKFLKDIGSSEATLRRQVEAQLAWQRLLSRQVSPFINVGDEEVKAVIDRIEAAKGTEEYHLKEIYLQALPGQEALVQQKMQQIMDQLRTGAPFEYFASTYSDATTRSVGGDLGWVRAGVLPDTMAAAAQQMQVGQVAGPITVPGGFSLLYLMDKRQVLMPNARDAKLSLRQITIAFPKDTTKAQAQLVAADFAKATGAIKGCGDVGDVAKKFNAEVVDNDSVVVRTLPPALQDMMLQMQIGQSTPPFGSIDQGVRVLVLCGRDDPKAAGLPSMDQIRDGIEQQRVSLRADRMLRDLRRDAVIEYK